MALLEETGMFTGVDRATKSHSSTFDTQKRHILSTVRALAQYDPVPFPKGKQPLNTHLIWATDSIEPADIDDSVRGPASVYSTEMPNIAMRLKSMLHAKRTNFGTDGWELLVGEATHVTTVDGDHFSIVTPPNVEQLGEKILHAVAMDAKLVSECED